MSPAGMRHRDYQMHIGHLLQLMKPDGISSTRAAVETSEYVKVPDVIWASRERWEAGPHEPTWQRAPEVCVEIVTPHDPLEEEKRKARLYLEAGASELWTCNDAGEIRFRDASGPLEKSRLCPEFPPWVESLPE